MPDQNIKPLYPVAPAGSVLKKKKSPDKKAPESVRDNDRNPKRKKKGIIDTYV
jgi:hypothetical protein